MVGEKLCLRCENVFQSTHTLFHVKMHRLSSCTFRSCHNCQGRRLIKNLLGASTISARASFFFVDSFFSLSSETSAQ